jgi:hypothetical protein
VKAWWRAGALLVVAAGIAVLADPAHRATIGRVLMVAAAAGLVAALAHRAQRRTPPAPPSPFDRRPVESHAAPVPHELARIAADLHLYSEPHGPRLGSGVLDVVVRDIVTDRLRRERRVVPDDLGAEPPAGLGTATEALLRRRRQPGVPVDPDTLAAELEALRSPPSHWQTPRSAPRRSSTRWSGRSLASARC